MTAQPSDNTPHSTRWQQLLNTVANKGAHVCEMLRCPKCSIINVHFHRFEETVVCGHCQHRHPTTNGAGCAYHDMIIHKLEEAVQSVKDWYPVELFGQDAGSPEELNTLPPEVRELVLRKCAHMARVVATNISAEFRRLIETEETLGIPEDEEDDSEGSVF